MTINWQHTKGVIAMKYRYILSGLLLFIFITGYAEAGNFGVGVHTGFGVIKYEEDTTLLADEYQSDTKLTTVLLGVSGEYTFQKFENLFAGITTDWALGLKGEERWDKNKIKFQTNDVRIFAQFYDGRLGYKNNIDKFNYRLYGSFGWDGVHFRRTNFVDENGVLTESTIAETFGLWRVGGGLSMGYRIGNLVLDGRAAYSYYFDGEVRSSNNDGIWFDTNGTCLDLGLGVIFPVAEDFNLYMGGSYTRLELDESEVKNGLQTGRPFASKFPNSQMQMIAGVVNLTYSF